MKKLIGWQLVMFTFIVLSYFACSFIGVSNAGSALFATLGLFLVSLVIFIASFFGEHNKVCALRVATFVALSAAIAAAAGFSLIVPLIALTTSFGAVFAYERLTKEGLRLVPWKVATAIILEWLAVYAFLM